MTQVVNLVLFRGLMGEVYSRGMDVLAMRLKKNPAVDFVVVDAYENWDEWTRQIKRWNDPTIVGGHSFGANAALMVAESLKNDVDIPLVLSFDPSPYHSPRLGRAGPPPVTKNVDRVLNFYQRIGPVIFGQKLVRDGGGGKGILNQRERVRHTAIDDHPRLHKQAREAVDELTGAIVGEEDLVA